MLKIACVAFGLWLVRKKNKSRFTFCQKPLELQLGMVGYVRDTLGARGREGQRARETREALFFYSQLITASNAPEVIYGMET